MKLKMKLKMKSLKLPKFFWICLLIVSIGASVYFIRSSHYFTAVTGKSMEPTLKQGQLILIKDAPIETIQEGDIIVVSVPSQVRKNYNYPPVIAHRVVEIYTKDKIRNFRTAGDNTGVDPFTVRASELKGKINDKIPYLGRDSLGFAYKIPLPFGRELRIPYHYQNSIPSIGYLLLFLRSREGMIAVALILLLLLIDSYGKELTEMRRNVVKTIFEPITQASEQRLQKNEEIIGGSLDSFASAMQEYAKHLASHTKAVENLANAAKELNKVVEQLDKSAKNGDESH